MYTSIFGYASPKFKDKETDAEINFRCRILKDEQDYKEVMHQSIINLHREWNDISEHWIYECEILLLKYPEADRKDLYLLLDSYENKVVEFWRRSDGDSNGDFRVDEVTPYYLDHPDYPDKIFMRFISASLIPPDTSLQFCEDFTGNTYDHDNWELIDWDIPGYEVSDEMLVGTYGAPIDKDLRHYKYLHFRHKYQSKPKTDIEVRGDMFVSDTDWFRTNAIGLWNSENHYALIALNNVYKDDLASLLIRNGETNIGDFTFAESYPDLDITVKRLYRITYSRKTNLIRSYYWNGLWVQMFEPVLVDFGDLQFYVGAFNGLLNAYVGGPVLTDDICVVFTPDI